MTAPALEVAMGALDTWQAVYDWAASVDEIVGTKPPNPSGFDQVPH